MGTNTVLAKDKKCGTCQYWNGDRKIRFVNNVPYSISADSGQYDCGVQSKKTYSAGTCPKWNKWNNL